MVVLHKEVYVFSLEDSRVAYRIADLWKSKGRQVLIEDSLIGIKVTSMTLVDTKALDELHG